MRATADATEKRFLTGLRKRAEQSLGRPIAEITELVDGIRGDDDFAQLATIADRITPTSSDTSEADRRPLTDAEKGARHKARAGKRQKQLSAANREIGPLPKVVDLKARAEVTESFQRFCELCLSKAFSREWSPDHIKVIRRIEGTVDTGGQFSLAMPRGSGKTTLCEAAVLWSLVTRRHRYVMIVGADEDKAGESLERIEAELAENDQLFELFPEVCFPIRALEGIKNRVKGQVCEGEPTRMKSKRDRVVLPTLTAGHLRRVGVEARDHDGEPLGEAELVPGLVVKAAGLLSATRGVQHRLATGERIRPSLVLLDDPQTRESAESDDLSAKRHRIITADLMGMVEPGEHLDVLMPCTVIRKGDLADLMLDRERTPDFRGIRQKMLYGWPDTDTPEGSAQWSRLEDYFELSEQCLKDGDSETGEHDDEELDVVDYTPANKFWRKHQKQLEAGLTAAWPDRYSRRRGEVSAVQHAFNIYRRDPEAFFAEFQNDPQDIYEDPGEALTTDQLAILVSGYERRQLPAAAETVTAFVDVQKRGLFWMVCGFANDFTSWVIDYGAWPKPNRSFFTARSMRPTLKEVYRGQGFEAALISGLGDLITQRLMRNQYEREDDIALDIDLLLIDAAWGQITDHVRSFVKASQDRKRLMPAIGRFIGPEHCPMSQYRPKKTEKIGHNWLLTRAGRQREVHPDTNYWKSFTAARLGTADGTPGTCRLYGVPGKQRHDFLARHLTCEYSKVESGRHTVDVWNCKTGDTENHWWDCLVGCHVAASMEGVKLVETKKKAGPGRARGSDAL